MASRYQAWFDLRCEDCNRRFRSTVARSACVYCTGPARSDDERCMVLQMNGSNTLAGDLAVFRVP